MNKAAKKKIENGSDAINHCGLSEDLRRKFDGDGDAITEAVMIRADKLVREAQTGEASAPEDPGIELLAREVANSTLAVGAKEVANDVGVDLSRLMRLSESQHISSC